jgi:hypothetical protein
MFHEKGGGAVTRLIKPLDCLFLALASLFTFFSAVVVYGGGGEALVLVKGGGDSWVFPLDAVERVAVSGPLGETVVEIRGGFARIVSSPCVNKTCIAAGTIHFRGQWTACLPNRVMVSISGHDKTDGSVDAAAW